MLMLSFQIRQVVIKYLPTNSTIRRKSTLSLPVPAKAISLTFRGFKAILFMFPKLLGSELHSANLLHHRCCFVNKLLMDKILFD